MFALRKNLKKLSVIVAGVSLAALAFHAEKKEAKAIPMFARRYGVPCSTCHTSAPRLNETGYQFRAAGFRMPSEIGKSPGAEHPFKATNHIGFRLQPRYDVTRTSVGSESHTFQKARLFAAEGYLWYAPISKYFSSNLKVTFWPDESNETELTERVEGTMRFTYGNADQFIDIRGGVPHPHEGFGGSEAYVVANTRPFIHELQSANFNQDTFFTPDGFHQAGGSVGYYHKRSTIRLQITDGIRVKEDDAGKLEPFGRRDPTTALPQSNKGGPDFNLFFNQILHHQAGNVSVQYYNGRSYLPRLDLLPPGTSLPVAVRPQAGPLADISRRLSFADNPMAFRSSPFGPGVTALEAAAAPVDLSNLPFFKNNFDRLGIYAGYPIKRVNLLYGIQRGRDTIGTGGRFSSLGHFGEAMVRCFNDISVVGARLDWFDPARNRDNNEMTGITAYMNVWLHSELRVTPEFQHLTFKRGTGQLDRVDNRFQLRLYWVK